MVSGASMVCKAFPMPTSSVSPRAILLAVIVSYALIVTAAFGMAPASHHNVRTEILTPLHVDAPTVEPYRDLPILPEPTTTSSAAVSTTTSTTVQVRPVVTHPTRGTPRSVTTTTTTQPSAPITTVVIAAVTTGDIPIPQVGCDPNSEKSYAEMVHCWDPLVRTHPWPNVGTVYRVMHCESKGKANAYNPQPVRVSDGHGRWHNAHARGIMQELDGPYDPRANIDRAWSMSNHGTNFGPWSSCL